MRAAIDAYNRRDFDSALKDAAPDFEIRLEPSEFIDLGEHVVVPWTMRAVGRDGIEVEARVTWTFTIRDGAVQRICMYQERDEALEAAGLRE